MFLTSHRGLLTGFLLASLSGAGLAQQPSMSVEPGNPFLLGQPFQIVVEGVPGDIPIILFDTELNTTPTPWGDILIQPNPSYSFVLPRIGQDGRSVFSCNTPVCDFTLAQQVYYGQAITFEFTRPLTFRGISELLIVEAVTGDDCAPKALDAATDDDVWSGTPHSEAFYLKDCDERRWSFTEPAVFAEYPDGTATLTGSIRSNSEPDDTFDVVVNFSNRVGPSDGVAYPPVDSPKLSGILPSALAENGGPIDPSEWHYYLDLNGTLTGTGDIAGLNYTLSRRGPAAQVGFGGSLKNTEYGLSTWLDVVRTSGSGAGCDGSMKGDINIILVRDCPPDDQPVH